VLALRFAWVDYKLKLINIMTKQEIKNKIEEVKLLWKGGKITLLRREQRLATLNRLLAKAK